MDTLCLLSAPESGGRGEAGATGEAGPALRWEALLKGMFTLRFQMGHKEQGILGVYKLQTRTKPRAHLLVTGHNCHPKAK